MAKKIITILYTEIVPILPILPIHDNNKTKHSWKRYESIPRNERICKYCNQNMTENEYHFLLVCPLYRELRHKYFKKYYCQWPTLNKFDDLMSKKSKIAVSNLSKFIFFAMKVRNSINLEWDKKYWISTDNVMCHRSCLKRHRYA